jgi:DNA-binding YbaB/EbfC family protein
MTNLPGDLGAMLRQVQQMQEDMAARQQELAKRRYEGSAGAGRVKAVVIGGTVESVLIDPSLLDDAEMLGDLVTVAVNQALTAANADSESTIGEVASGLDLGRLLG